MSEAIDSVAKGDVAHGLDLLVCRFKALQKTAADGHSRISRWLELIPSSEQGVSITPGDEEMITAIEASDAKMRALLEKSKGK